MAYRRTKRSTGGYRRRYRRRPMYRTRRTYNTSRRRYRRRSNVEYVKASNVPRSSLTRFTLAQVNPFDTRVYGAKIPDSNTMSSSTFQADDQIAIVQSATNQCRAQAFFPNLKCVTVPGSPSGPQTWSWPATFGGQVASSKLSSANSAFSVWRPVAHGLRISASQTLTNATGYVHICIIPMPMYNSTTYDLPQSVSTMSDSSWYYRWPLSMLTQKNLIIVNKFLDATSSKYIDTDSSMIAGANDVNFQVPSQWATIIVAVENGGSGSTTLISIESLVHGEAVPAAGSLNQATPAAPFSPSTLSAASMIAGESPAAYTEESVASVVLEANNVASRVGMLCRIVQYVL